jgi:DNA repair protein RadD
VIDYAGNRMNLHHPEVGEPKPDPDSEPVQVFCPGCGFANIFWGKTDSDGRVIEHYGRRCQGLLAPAEGEDAAGHNGRPQQCDYRFRFKECPHCGGENDIAARTCGHCQQAIIDPDDQLREALQLKDAMVIRCAGLSLSGEGSTLKLTYHGEDGEELRETFDFSKPGQRAVFNKLFGRRFAGGQAPKTFTGVAQVLAAQALLPAPDFVIARKHNKRYWQVQARVFDYQGPYRKAHAL